MRTVIGIAGSPRKNGNSTTLLRSALKGARLSGAETKEVYLNGLVFKGCQGCRKCSPKGKCILNDDLTPILADLRKAEGWLLASPIYFDSVSGQMKAFFDRCHTFIVDPKSQDLKPQLEGKRKGIVILSYEDTPRKEYLGEAQKLTKYLGWMGDFVKVEIFSEANLGSTDAAKKKPDLLAKVEKTGQDLFI